MATQMNVAAIEKFSERWSEALVRTYNVDGVLLTDQAFAWLNSENSGIRFAASEYVEDEENGGPRTMVNVYVSDRDGFDKAEEILSLMEKRISDYQHMMETRALFADSIGGLLEKRDDR